VVVKSEVVFVVDEVENMCVRAGEFLFGALSERIVPYYPVSHDEAKFVGDDFYVGGVLISYSDVE
jgi:hypothetical protein